MTIDIKTIDKLANLSKLSFNEQEKINIKSDLEKMIGFINQLQQVDTTGVLPLIHITDSINSLRNDVLGNSISKENGLLNAPLKDENYFLVPKVIKK
jgi:aspartyl-tRNA(Asn)/glutamyl-tRNA(Gln) amidotransferase subunit C